MVVIKVCLSLSLAGNSDAENPRVFVFMNLSLFLVVIKVSMVVVAQIPDTCVDVMCELPGRQVSLSPIYLPYHLSFHHNCVPIVHLSTSHVSLWPIYPQAMCPYRPSIHRSRHVHVRGRDVRADRTPGLPIAHLSSISSICPPAMCPYRPSTHQPCVPITHLSTRHVSLPPIYPPAMSLSLIYEYIR